jgi:hypothetical protein
MEAENASKTSLKEKNSLFFSSPPSLPLILNLSYGVLSDDMKRLFVRMYKYLWGVVHKKDSSVSLFWCVDLLRLRYSLTCSEFTGLTFIYQISCKGVRFVHSDQVYNGPILQAFNHESKKTLLNTLKHKGWITRHTKNPQEPYSQRAQHNKQPVFIKMTVKGVNLIEGIEKDMNKILLNTSLDELTGNKKPG